MLVYTLLFEDHKNVWIYQKCTFSSIVMNEGQAYNIAMEVVGREERSDERKLILAGEIEKLLKDLPLTLDQKGRDAFNSKFNTLKTFIYEMTA
jgi:hypothetical protein